MELLAAILLPEKGANTEESRAEWLMRGQIPMIDLSETGLSNKDPREVGGEFAKPT